MDFLPAPRDDTSARGAVLLPCQDVPAPYQDVDPARRDATLPARDAPAAFADDLATRGAAPAPHEESLAEGRKNLFFLCNPEKIGPNSLSHLPQHLPRSPIGHAADSTHLFLLL